MLALKKKLKHVCINDAEYACNYKRFPPRQDFQFTKMFGLAGNFIEFFIKATTPIKTLGLIEKITSQVRENRTPEHFCPNAFEEHPQYQPGSLLRKLGRFAHSFSIIGSRGLYFLIIKIRNPEKHVRFVFA